MQTHHHLYQPLLVAFSILLACIGSYAALTMTAQIEGIALRVRGWWRVLTACTAGLTIWAMHFVGMLACELPVPVTYNPWVTLLSLLVAEGAALISLLILPGESFSIWNIVGSGVLFGLGVASMHYIGMAGLRGAVTLHYDPVWVLISVLIAVVAATVALWLLHRVRQPHSGVRLAAAVVMGAAISAMHYAGMQAVTFMPTAGAVVGGASQLAALAFAVIAAAIIIFVLLLVTLQVGRQFSLQGRLRDELRQRVDLGEQQYWTVINNLTEGVLIIDHEGKLVDCNESARRIFELPHQDVSVIQQLGNYHFYDASGQHVPLAQMPGNRAMALNTTIANVPLALHLPNGTRKWLSLSAKPLPAHPNELPGAVVSFTDITQERRYEAQLLDQAQHDELTHLPNRRQFYTALTGAMADADKHGTQVAVLYFDLDHFKNVNDTLGHTVGDEVLCVVAQRLLSVLPVGSLPARFGGDEFAVLLPGIAQNSEVQEITSQIHQALAMPIQLEGRELHTSVSIGFSFYPADGQDVTTLIKHADLALNHVKSSGRGDSLRYSPVQAQRRTREVGIERALRSSLGTAQFTLAYQPIYFLASKQLRKCEALIRWTHPELGQISPAEFIPIAEESGLIIPLGEWVLRAACRQAQQWRQAGHPLPIAVNISMRQFSDGQLPALIEQLLAEYSLQPSDLIVEITETTLMNQKDDVAGQLKQIRQLGTLVALDDFGTGFSSLQLLHELPIDHLKLDRGFIESMSSNSRQHLLVKNIITLAHGLGLTVIAEGIETTQQRADLISFKCEVGQGYLLSRPLTAAGMSDLLQNRATV